MENFLIEKIEELSFTRVAADEMLWPFVLDSITIVELSVELERAYSIKIAIEEITEDNFVTVDKIAAFIKKKQN